jgi:uncharacterized protein YndB with AHSA1/START domain
VTERSTIHSSLVIERSYDADGWETDVFELDFRVEGHETYRGGPKEGPAVSLDGRYHDIVANERIVYAYDMHLDGVRISVSLTTIELLPEGNGTRLVFTEHDTFLDGHESAGSREEGTRGPLEVLDAEVRREAVKP